MSHVTVLDSAKRALDQVHQGRARRLPRRLLSLRSAAVFRRYPFTIILKHSVPDAQPEPFRVKIDPGSKTTGLALVSDRSGAVVTAGSKAGVYTGRVAVRATRAFNITTTQATAQAVPARYCRVIHRADGYSYHQKGGAALPPHA